MPVGMVPVCHRIDMLLLVWWR